MMECYVDGSCPDPGGRSIGWAYYMTGDGIDICERGSERVFPPRRATSALAEYIAMVVALQRLVEVGKPAMVMSDSCLVMNHLTGKWEFSSPSLEDLYRRCKELASMLPSVEFKWVARSEPGILRVNGLMREWKKAAAND